MDVFPAAAHRPRRWSVLAMGQHLKPARASGRDLPRSAARAGTSSAGASAAPAREPVAPASGDALRAAPMAHGRAPARCSALHLRATCVDYGATGVPSRRSVVRATGQLGGLHMSASPSLTLREPSSDQPAAPALDCCVRDRQRHGARRRPVQGAGARTAVHRAR